VNSAIGYAVGESGVILKTTAGGEPIGIQPISTEIPQRFVLYQNYPNPFNPVTKIKFSIPVASLSSIGEGSGVRLIVYDLLGREAAVLVNEQLTPGTYEVEWNGSNYASGIYFYQLRTNKFSESKKMVLVK
jgi:Secretion system C-terminal sorting domain